MTTRAAIDRGEIIHLAGAHDLSPALREGAPALLPMGDNAGRCGWEPFFRALDQRRLAVAFDEDGTARFLPAAQVPPHAPQRSELAEARRFLQALQGRWGGGAG